MRGPEWNPLNQLRRWGRGRIDGRCPSCSRRVFAALALALFALPVDPRAIFGQSLLVVFGTRDNAEIGLAFMHFRLGTARAVAEDQRAVFVHAAVNLRQRRSAQA